MDKFSVLISVYKKDRAEFLNAALQSVFNQSVSPNEVVLVKDGNLTPELEEIIEDYVLKYPIQIRIISLPQNVGLGLALNEGLKHCSSELVARMDADDVCKFDRFEKQMNVFKERSNITIVGSWLDEFVDKPENVVSIKKLPQENEQLVEYAKSRSPLNHPTVMFKKSAIQKVGGYKHFYLLEDYFLWGRLIVSGFEFYNIQESLLSFRMNSQMIARRGGWEYAKSEIRLFKEFQKMKFISYPVFLRNIIVRFGVRLMPNRVRKIIYQKLLR